MEPRLTWNSLRFCLSILSIGIIDTPPCTAEDALFNLSFAWKDNQLKCTIPSFTYFRKLGKLLNRAVCKWCVTRWVIGWLSQCLFASREITWELWIQESPFPLGLLKAFHQPALTLQKILFSTFNNYVPSLPFLCDFSKSLFRHQRYGKKPHKIVHMVTSPCSFTAGKRE